MKLAKGRNSTGQVHIIDLDAVPTAPPIGSFRLTVCRTSVQVAMEPWWIDDMSIGCPVCRTFVVDWLLGRGVSREARQLVQDDVEWRHRQVPTVPRGWGKGHGASEGDPSL